MINTTDVREREDLSPIIDTLLLKDDDMKFLSMINFLPKISELFGNKVTAQKHEWKDESARDVSIQLGVSPGGTLWNHVSTAAALPMTAGECAKLRIGDVLLLPDTLEVVVVKTISIAANTIAVWVRGHGSTAGAAQTDSLYAKVIGNAQIEDGDPLDSDFVAEVAGYNYSQIFEDVAAVTGTIRRSGVVGGDLLDRQVIKKTKEALKSLNVAIIEGIRELTNKIGTMGGLREFFTNTSNVGGALTVAKFYLALVSHIDAGLFPSAIHASPTTISKIEQLFNGGIATKADDRRGGRSITVIMAMGYEIELHIDRDIRSAEFLIIDYNRVAFGPLDGGQYESGSFSTYPINQNGKQIEKQVLGEYTLRCSNGGGTRAYGIT